MSQLTLNIFNVFALIDYKTGVSVAQVVETDCCNISILTLMQGKIVV